MLGSMAKTEVASEIQIQLGKALEEKCEHCKITRKFTCPAWWCELLNNPRKPNWEECCHPGVLYSSCVHFSEKALCWEKFDKQTKKEEKWKEGVE